MTNEILLAEQFESERPRLRAVAMRMLGSDAGADDAVQEAWIRLVRTDVRAAEGGEQIENLPGWLTTVVSRISAPRWAWRPYDASRGGLARRGRLRRPGADPGGRGGARRRGRPGDERRPRLARPSKRLAYVLKDVFDLPFDAIARILGRTEVATRQLASRAGAATANPSRARTWPLPTPRSSTPSCRPRTTTSSRRCSSCSTLTPRCGPTTQRWRWVATPARSSAVAQWRSSSPAGQGLRCPPRSTAPQPRVGSTRARSRSSSVSPSSGARSSRSRCSPTPT